MLTKESIFKYKNLLHKINENSVVVPPHKKLSSYIANYTFTDPSKMSTQQTILPTISSTIVCSLGDDGIINGLRGVNTKPVMIADYARQFDFMFLIEFHAGGLYPFVDINQNELADKGFLLEELDSVLNQQITKAYYSSNDIQKLTVKLDNIFLSRISIFEPNSKVIYALEKILESKGDIRVKELAKEVYYSEKQLNRLFMKYIGVNIKMCARIVRMKKIVNLLENSKIEKLIEMTGHHDYAHFVNDFIKIYGFTPKEYKNKMSIFYNDPFKL